MRRKIHRQLMRWQRFVVVAVLLGISLFVLWAWSQQLSISIIIGSSSALVIATLLVGGYYYKWAWTGLSDYAYPKVDGVEFYHRKTLWDWLQLLIIPSVLAGAALLFNAQSTQTQLEITTDNQREAALQAYIDKMSELLLDGKLRTSEVGSEIRSVARTRTLSTLRQLDNERKRQVLQFLQESQLISGTDTIIDLRNSNLQGADLAMTSLNWANLQGANLQGANLQGAALYKAKLGWTDLVRANLQGAFIPKANFHWANLQGANLAGAFISEASFWRTNLTGANLTGANLQRANLEGVILEEANLEGADLQGANLKDAVVTPEQLAQAASLQGATMPDGSIHP